MMTQEVFVAIGSNLADPLGQARRAVVALAALPGSALQQASSFYSSRPMGPADQPDYVNAVVRLTTRLAPLALLDQLQRIELEQGRVRKDERWGPRSLDLDLLLYGAECLQSERLTVPHYGMKEREFVLLPLFEIAPALVLPCGTPLNDLVARCPRNDLAIIASAASL
ncbi:2-amino-4-hydroxy-6-hydroxymethyldihydropteridine diphosphokinase [Aeromonas sp. BIGb0405]|jgi:2-amino-4-hydroxy-6-hydroxymethyldihydropteridine diphosphokinase|nr:2-amino-4-hydroxy-6-hydroxymethyldihydropteridine diphosphokinase [Aeromonas sp. BIGb0405]